MTDASFDALVGQAEQALQSGDVSSAKTIIPEAARMVPNTAPAHFQLGSLMYVVQEFQGALEQFRLATELSPELPEPWHNTGLVLESLLRHEDAISAYKEATDRAPDWQDPWKTLGLALVRVDRSAEAIGPLEKALALNPGDAETAFFLGNACLANQDGVKAANVLGRAAALVGDDADVHNNYGQALEFNGNSEEAARAYERAIEIEPDHVGAIGNLARVLLQLNRGEDAEKALRHAIALRPDDPAAYVELGSYLQNHQRNNEATEIMRKGVDISDDDPVLVNNLAVSLASIGQYAESKKWYDRLIQLLPDHAAPLVNYASMLEMMERSDEALLMLQHAARVEPSYAPTYSLLVHGKLRQCQWDNLEAHVTRIIEDSKREIADGKKLSALPFILLALPVPLDIRLAASRQLADSASASVLAPGQPKPFTHVAPKAGSKIRIGYISPDFRMHSVGMCFRSIVAGHDRENFEVFGYHMALKPDDETTTYFRETFDHFRDIRQLSTMEAAQQIHDDGINILIDLAGHTRGSRIEILALRPAPVQVHYLGYGATTGADFIDYLISDDTVIDEEAVRWCSETLAYMPTTFMPPLALPKPEKLLSRANEGLPEEAFVFANFCAHYKIDPDIFSIWMRLLKRAPGSVLWLVSGSDHSVENLKREAGIRGIDPDRLIFAPRRDHHTHITRHHLADLCLDNCFHAGGATTLEALWSGLPVLTMHGPYPNSRTGAGMLKAAGLPELVAKDLENYREIAENLVTSPETLARLRKRLSEDKKSAPLFDSNYFVPRLERILTKMWQASTSGTPPVTIRLED